jgi:hypothetical protein
MMTRRELYDLPPDKRQTWVKEHPYAIPEGVAPPEPPDEMVDEAWRYAGEEE